MSDADWMIRTDHDEGIVSLTLNRAPVNALSPDFLMGLAATLDQWAQDDAVRAVVIDSAFKVYSAGLDLKEAQSFDLAQQDAIVEGLNVGFLSLFAFPKPVVVCVNGAAIAGGLFFVLASDMRVATARARFGLAEVRVGVDFPVGPLEIARATLDPNALRRLMLSGAPVDGTTALQMGLVDQVVDPEDLAATARALAEAPPSAYAAVKRQIRGATIARIETLIAEHGHSADGGWFKPETKAAMQKMIG